MVLRGLPSAVLNKILALNDGAVRVMMGDILEKDEIDALMARLDHVKRRIRIIAQKDGAATLTQRNIHIPVMNKQGNELVEAKGEFTEKLLAETISFSDEKNDDARAIEALKYLSNQNDNIMQISCFDEKFAKNYLKELNKKNELNQKKEQE